MRHWTLLSRAEQGRGILSGAWTTSTCYKPREIERCTLQRCPPTEPCRSVTPLCGGTGGKAAPGRGFHKTLHETNNHWNTQQRPEDFPDSQMIWLSQSE